jgi:hypothetical protein
MVLSWIMGGVCNEDRVLQLGRHTVKLDRGVTWGSTDSMIEDIHAATGRTFTRNEVRYALEKLVSRGLIEDRGSAVEGARGFFGKIYRPTLPQSRTMRFYAFNHTSHTPFQHTEVVAGNYDDFSRRGKFGKGDVWERQWAKRGYDDPSFVRVGRWRSKDATDPAAPVYVPWIILDIDRDDILEAFEDARLVLEGIEAEGFTLNDVMVAFSGRRGLHILFPAGKLGNPVFANSDIAAVMVWYIAEKLAGEVVIDPSTTSPLTLVRVVGSRHEKTSHYKRAFHAEDFMSKSPGEMLVNLNTFVPIDMPDPTMAEPEGDDEAILEAAAMYAEAELSDEAKNRRKKDESHTKGRGIIAAIEAGVKEGTNFAPGNYHGRSKANFLYARYLTNNLGLSYEEAVPRLLAVNARHQPPMPESRVRYILKWTLRNDARK